MENLLDTINQALQSARSAIGPSDDYLVTQVITQSHRIDIIADPNEVDIVITSHRHPHREYTNLETSLSRRCHQWHELEVEPQPSVWNLHGFASESDYARYRL